VGSKYALRCLRVCLNVHMHTTIINLRTICSCSQTKYSFHPFYPNLLHPLCCLNRSWVQTSLMLKHWNFPLPKSGGYCMCERKFIRCCLKWNEWLVWKKVVPTKCYESAQKSNLISTRLVIKKESLILITFNADTPNFKIAFRQFFKFEINEC
jgi:hypothetical protein